MAESVTYSECVRRVVYRHVVHPSARLNQNRKPLECYSTRNNSISFRNNHFRIFHFGSTSSLSQDTANRLRPKSRRRDHMVITVVSFYVVGLMRQSTKPNEMQSGPTTTPQLKRFQCFSTQKKRKQNVFIDVVAPNVCLRLKHLRYLQLRSHSYATHTYAAHSIVFIRLNCMCSMFDGIFVFHFVVVSFISSKILEHVSLCVQIYIVCEYEQ